VGVIGKTLLLATGTLFGSRTLRYTVEVEAINRESTGSEKFSFSAAFFRLCLLASMPLLEDRVFVHPMLFKKERL
jgi:hypothetical protein